MDVEDKRVSKLYRKILTSNEMLGLITYQNLDRDLQEKVKQRMIQNGSITATKLLTQIESIQGG